MWLTDSSRAGSADVWHSFGMPRTYTGGGIRNGIASRITEFGSKPALGNFQLKPLYFKGEKNRGSE